VKILQIGSFSFGWTEGQGLDNDGLHRLDERDGVGHNIVPLGVGPGALATLLPVSQALVTPNVEDGVKLPELSKESGVWRVFADCTPVLDTAGPVVTPVVHGPRLQTVRPYIVNIVPWSLVWTWPERKCLGKLDMLLRQHRPTCSKCRLIFIVGFKYISRGINI